MSEKNKKVVTSPIFATFSSPPVSTSTFSGYGQIVLNRPKKLNSMTFEITQNIITFLENCILDDNIKLIVLKGAGRAFCAGWDLQEMLNGITGDKKSVSDLFIGVYEINRCIYMMAALKKPLITIMDGLTVGVGIGCAQISAFKIATENTVLSLPEAAIGQSIGAGKTFTFSRLDNYLGTYLVLTGHPLYAEDVLFAGLATHFVKSENLEALQSALAQIVDNASLDTIETAIQKFAVQSNHIAKHYTLHGKKMEIIQSCFKYDSVKEIISALQQENSEFSKRCLDSMNSHSPTALELLLMLLREGAHRSFGKCMDYEYYYWRNLQFSHDFVEGIIAVKEKRHPKWIPATLENLNLEEELAKSNCLTLLAYPRHNPSVNFAISPYKRYTLPTTEDVENICKKYKLSTKRDILNWFMESGLGNKYGVKQKLEHILKMGDNQTDDPLAKL